MKFTKQFLIAACLLWSLTGFAQTAPYLLQFKSVGELQQFLSWTPKRYPLISAHRGGPAKGFPENAIETFANSILSQPMIIECDITLSKDSVMVMMHDDKLDRTTNGTGSVSNYTLEELKKLRLKDNEGNLTDFQIPTLEEVLIWGKDKVIYTLDVKRSVPYAMVTEAVRKHNAAAYSVIITYNADQAVLVHKLAPELMISASISSKEILDRLHNGGIPDEKLVAFVGTREADSTLYSLLHEHRIMCILGTMGNLDNSAKARGEKVYYDLISRGADILSSDRPVEAGNMLQQYVKENKLGTSHIKH